ncbi:MAG: YraN family protein [Candidatus Komeilibacteria bacterium]|nr:YraN family protein [Candidatus Komeilibacteria bacterium]
MAYVRHAVGRWGESYASEFLAERGFVILERNWRCSHGEIDIVCMKRGVLYAVEVKTRQVLTFGYPEEAITPKKLERMRRCARAYAQMESGLGRIRVGLIALYHTRTTVSIRLYTDL